MKRHSADWLAAREALTTMQALASAAFTQYFRSPSEDSRERYESYRVLCKTLENRLTEIETQEREAREARKVAA